jgi:hypothetical protein
LVRSGEGAGAGAGVDVKDTRFVVASAGTSGGEDAANDTCFLDGP